MTGHAELQVLWLKPLLSTLDRSSTKLSKPICATTPRTTCGWLPLETCCNCLRPTTSHTLGLLQACFRMCCALQQYSAAGFGKVPTAQNATEHSRGIIELNLALS